MELAAGGNGITDGTGSKTWLSLSAGLGMLLCIHPMDCWFLAFRFMYSISLWTFLCSLFFILWTLLSFIVINCAISSPDHKVVINLS